MENQYILSKYNMQNVTDKRNINKIFLIWTIY